MTPNLQDRFLRVIANLEKLDRLHSIVSNGQNTSPRSLIASAAMAGAEFMAAAAGKSSNTGVVYRAYEEIFAALESSEAVNEMFASMSKSAEIQNDSALNAVNSLQEFRERLLSGGSND